MIAIVPYDPAWPAAFAGEAGRIRAALGDDALRIDHVGSTAVPGLAAKPVIDIQVSVPSLQPASRYDSALGALGYVHVPLGPFDLVYPFYEKPDGWPATHHVHLCVAGSALEGDHLAFRDCLRQDASVAAEYVALKLRLAAEHDGGTLASRERYSLAKSRRFGPRRRPGSSQGPRLPRRANCRCFVPRPRATTSAATSRRRPRCGVQQVVMTRPTRAPCAGRG